MQEVYPGLFVGDQIDYQKLRNREELQGWAVVHACKEPFHREFVGYGGRGAPTDDPEYYFAVRGAELALNLIDVSHVSYISQQAIDAGLLFIHEHLHDSGEKWNVLVHCNRGQSRGPGLALLYLHLLTDQYPDSLAVSELAFRGLYPAYDPGAGIHGYLAEIW